ncbi:MAG: SAM-dependent methyltransferase [SAR86 cluster bacterium]|uniref:SAM-dependent methyltransferase n=1 Tax=SAR86 cluster bacterium TaxID=2030880 RepID=A0A2A5B5U1_9GAMM|nr:MAG: SAM-dependent methyltransferase [SAR86 cluster bacterium]
MLKNIFSRFFPDKHGEELDTIDHWGDQANRLEKEARPTAWSDHPFIISNYINPAVAGNSKTGWLEAISRDFFPQPVARVLGLGCGGGALELQGVHWKIGKCFEGFDFSQGAIELARKNANEAGVSHIIKYEVADLNTHVFPEDDFDAVFASQSVHHIADLEHYMAQVARALKPGGLFVINEFVGPNQFQWTDNQLFHANRLLHLIPDELRIGLRSNTFVEEISRPTIDHMNAIDPTEAIRSGDIIETLENNFEIVEKRDFGGTLLQLVLNDIAGNFTDSDEHVALLESLIEEERALINTGEIISDFTLIVARNSKIKSH